MKTLIVATAFAVISSAAFAQSTLGTKDTSSQGTAEGVGASSYTGNGDVVGGNGTSGADQTTSAGSRVGAMQSGGFMNGNANGLANGNNGQTKN